MKKPPTQDKPTWNQRRYSPFPICLSHTISSSDQLSSTVCQSLTGLSIRWVSPAPPSSFIILDFIIFIFSSLIPGTLESNGSSHKRLKDSWRAVFIFCHLRDKQNALDYCSKLGEWRKKREKNMVVEQRWLSKEETNGSEHILIKSIHISCSHTTLTPVIPGCRFEFLTNIFRKVCMS